MRRSSRGSTSSWQRVSSGPRRQPSRSTSVGRSGTVRYGMKFTSAEEAVRCVRSGQRVFVHGGAATPQVLLRALAARGKELRDVELVSLHTEGEQPCAAPELAESFRINALFLGANTREAVARGDADYIPAFLSEMPDLFRRGTLPLDVALVHVSPPDSARLLLARRVGGHRPRRRGLPPRRRRSRRSTRACRARTATASMHHDACSTQPSPYRRGAARAIAPAAELGDAERAIGRQLRGADRRTARPCRWASARSPTPCSRALEWAPRPRRAHRDVFRRRACALVEMRRHHGRRNKAVARAPHRVGLRHGVTRRVYDFLDDNPDGRHARDISFVNDPNDHPPQPEGRRDQLARSRSTSPVRSARTRSAPGSTRASAARWTSCAARRCPPGGKPVIAMPSHDVASGLSRIVRDPQARRRRRHDARARALGRHRVRRRRPARQEPAPARPRADRASRTRTTARSSSARRSSGSTGCRDVAEQASRAARSHERRFRSDCVPSSGTSRSASSAVGAANAACSLPG